MTEKLEAVVAGPADRTRESFDDPRRGEASWFTLFGGEVSRTAHLSGGLCELEPGGQLAAHRHTAVEAYFVHEGAGTITIDGVARKVTTGMAVFIPGDAEHRMHNHTDAPLKFFYVFATDRFSDVVYRFS